MSQNGNQNNQNNKQQNLSWSNPQQGQSAQPPKQEQKQPQQQAKPAPVVVSAPAKSASSNRSAAKVTGWLAAGVVAGVVIAWGITGLVRHGGTAATTAGSLQNATSTDEGASSGSGLLTVAAQKAGMSVAVSDVNVSEPTWVAVYESRSGKPGNVLGAALFFPGNPSGTVELLRGTVAGETYFVTELKDNGDHKFSMKADTPLMIDNQQAWESFTAN